MPITSRQSTSTARITCLLSMEISSQSVVLRVRVLRVRVLRVGVLRVRVQRVRVLRVRVLQVLQVLQAKGGLIRASNSI